MYQVHSYVMYLIVVKEVKVSGLKITSKTFQFIIFYKQCLGVYRIVQILRVAVALHLSFHCNIFFTLTQLHIRSHSWRNSANLPIHTQSPAQEVRKAAALGED